MSNQFSQQPLEAQPLRKILRTLVRVPPMNLDAAGALLFLVSIILYPSGLFFNLLFAALAAYIVYGAVRRAEVYTLLQDATFPQELDGAVRHFFVKPRTIEVVRQVFRSPINIIFGVAIILNMYTIVGYLMLTPIPVLSVISAVLVLFVYVLFSISNGYTRAQQIEAYGAAPRMFR